MAISFQNPTIAWLDKLLHDWGAWASNISGTGRAPDGSIIGRLMDEGPSASERGAFGAPIFTTEDEVFLRVDIEVAGIPEKSIQDALRYHYVYRWSQDKGARRLRLSKDAYKARLERGRWWMAGRLADMEKTNLSVQINKKTCEGAL